MTSSTNVNRFREARDRACEYLLKQQHADGSFGKPENGLIDYYKVPFCLATCGASAEANRLCGWIRRHGITPEGDFGPRPPLTMEYFYAYFNAWVIMGAQRQGHFDLAQRGMKFLLTFRDPETGGFYSSHTARTATTKQDLFVVAGCGQAALYTGMIEVGRGVGEWLKRVFDQQPNFPQQLYSIYTRAGGLQLKPDPGEEIRCANPHNPTSDGYFFNPGIAAGFLASLHKATGEANWLELAKQYLRQAEIANEYFLSSPRAGKVAWGASLLYTLTGEEKYRQLAMRVGDLLMASQSPDGHWEMFGDPQFTIDLTAELGVWLDEVHQAVGPAPALQAENSADCPWGD